MTQESKELLLKDISARLPYGVKVLINDPDRREYTLKADYGDLFLLKKVNTNIKPYLRPMSSMTVEEKKIQKDYVHHFLRNNLPDYENDFVFKDEAHEYIDWLNKQHFDYRGLIEKGLALEAPTNMYKTE